MAEQDTLGALAIERQEGKAEGKPEGEREALLVLLARRSIAVMEEIHATREAPSKASGDDIRRIAEAARARQAQSGRKTVRLAPRPAKATRLAS